MMASLQEVLAEPKTLRLLGLNLHCISYDDMFRVFDHWLRADSNKGFSVALINVDCCVSGLLDLRVRQVYQEADLLGVDGRPFLYLARVLRNTKSDQLCAPEMILQCARVAPDRGYKFFLYGGRPGYLERMIIFLKAVNPSLTISGKYCPPFRDLTPEEDHQVCQIITASGANLVWVGLGSPKQDLWIRQHRDKLPGCILIASGATFDFYSGRIRRAPSWCSKCGLEWLYRLSQDPRRLCKRYTIFNVLFCVALLLELLGILKLGPKGTSKSHLML
jgi:N-acetylglucosaminyldiphosphoundecaprenol N-acetyl-beta-D-mannosaminyltransferase